jgi:hypothetical protein
MLLLAVVAAVANQVEQVQLVAQAAEVLVVMEELLQFILELLDSQIQDLEVVEQVTLEIHQQEILEVLVVPVSFSSHTQPDKYLKT